MNLARNLGINYIPCCAFVLMKHNKGITTTPLYYGLNI